MREKAKYMVKIYWSDEDEAYVAEVPALPGCVSHGETYPKAAKNIQEAMSLWLASAKKHGDPIPETDIAAEEVERLAPILNLSKLSRLAGINLNTLQSKVRRKSRFTPEEARKIREALARV